MKEDGYEVKNHDNFMTEKEKKFVESYNKKGVLNALHQKDFSTFFEGKPDTSLIITKKEKKSEQKAEDGDLQRNLFNSITSRSKKRPRLMLLESETCASPSLELDVKIEEFCTLVLKIKYRYNEVLVEDGSTLGGGYDPEKAFPSQVMEHESTAINLLQQHFVGMSSSPKFFVALSSFYNKADEKTQRNIVLTIINTSRQLKFTPFLKSFLDEIFQKFPQISRSEIAEFFPVFHNTVTGLTLAIVLVLKNQELSRHFKSFLNPKVVEVLFKLPDQTKVWQFFGVMASVLDSKEKKELIALLRKNLLEAVGNKNNKSVGIFLRSIGVDRESLL